MYSMVQRAALICLISSLATGSLLMAQTMGTPRRADSVLACQQGKAALAEAMADWKSRSTDNCDVLSYTISIDLDFDNQEITALCEVGLESTEAGLTEFALDFIGLTVTGVMENGATAVSWTHDDEELRITPSSPMSMGESRVFAIAYQGSPLGGLRFNMDNGGIAYTHTQPELSRYWFPCRDVPDDKADWYRGHITAPSDLLVASNGALQGIVNNGDGTSTTSYFLDYPVPTYLISLAVSDYLTFEQTTSGGIPVKYFVYPEHYDDAVYDWANVPAMIEFYSTVFEPYPFASYGHAVAPLPGAMEHQTMTTMGSRWITGNRVNQGIVAHELAHQWWGDLVTCGTWMDIWLNEGAATYFDSLFTEHFYGDLYFHYEMLNSRWTYFNSDAGSEGRFPIYDPVFMFGDTVYRKGAWILHMIRSLEGYAAFVDIFREWADRYRFDSAVTADFQQVVEDVTGEDWDWFFDQWVYMAGYPEYRLSWSTTAGNLHVTIEQIQELDDVTPIFDMPLDLLIETPAGDVETSVRVDQQMETFIISVPAEPIRVIADPGMKVLCKIQGLDGLVVGPGPHYDNRCAARAFDPYGVPLGPEITPYGVPHHGTNVAAGDLDGDGYDEILTGAGPGPVFGPHVRAFDYDGAGPVSPMPGVSYFAYGTLRWGVNVAAGDIDGDGYDEIITGAGPGPVFGAHVRGWNVDNGPASAIPGVSFFAYGTPRWGVNVACGDIDADGLAEIITAPGPSPSFPCHIRGFNYDGGSLEPMDSVNFIALNAMYGGRIGTGDMTGDGAADIIVSPGPQPGFGAWIVSYFINAEGETEPSSSFEAFSGMDEGGNAAGGRFPLDGYP